MAHQGGEIPGIALQARLEGGLRLCGVALGKVEIAERGIHVRVVGLLGEEALEHLLLLGLLSVRSCNEGEIVECVDVLGGFCDDSVEHGLGVVELPGGEEVVRELHLGFEVAGVLTDHAAEGLDGVLGIAGREVFRNVAVGVA